MVSCKNGVGRVVWDHAQSFEVAEGTPTHRAGASAVGVSDEKASGIGAACVFLNLLFAQVNVWSLSHTERSLESLLWSMRNRTKHCYCIPVRMNWGSNGSNAIQPVPMNALVLPRHIHFAKPSKKSTQLHHAPLRCLPLPAVPGRRIKGCEKHRDTVLRIITISRMCKATWSVKTVIWWSFYVNCLRKCTGISSALPKDGIIRPIPAKIVTICPYRKDGGRPRRPGA